MSDLTCWTLIDGAKSGDAAARDDFVRRYIGVVRAYLGERWRGSHSASEVDDAVQDVFLECFRGGGALDRLDADRQGGFRAYLVGVVRNIARRVESQRARRADAQASDADRELDQASREERLSGVFDREWARAIMREAADRQRGKAERVGEEALRRVELLRLRFHEDLPLREIAGLWGADADKLRHELARSQREFRTALLEVVEFHHPGPRASVEREIDRLLEVLS